MVRVVVVIRVGMVVVAIRVVTVVLVISTVTVIFNHLPYQTHLTCHGHPAQPFIRWVIFLKMKEEVSLLELVREQNYKGIVEHPDAQNEEKVISLVNLGRFKEALSLARNNSFEKAYCYYKLGKPRSCLKTAGKKTGEKWSALRMQAYYVLDRYEDAVKEGSVLKKEGASLVNYSAALSLLSLERGEALEEIEKIEEHAQHLHGAIREEVMYNLSFSALPNKEKFVEKLKKINPAEKETVSLVESQINTALGNLESVEEGALNRRDRLVHRYNAEGRAEGLEETLKLFQREIYYKNKIKMYLKEEGGAEEISQIEKALKENSPGSAVKLAKRMAICNVSHLVHALTKKGANAKCLKRFLNSSASALKEK